MNKDKVVTLMESSKSEQEWNDNTIKVKKAFNGQYPDFWYEAVIQSGLHQRVAAGFGGSADFKITSLSERKLEIHGRPTSFPYLQEGEKVVAEYDQGLGPKRGTCPDIRAMQGVYDSYARGMALSLKWFVVSESAKTIPTAS